MMKINALLVAAALTVCAAPALAQQVACANDFTGCTNGTISPGGGGGATGANPTATATGTAINGSAITFMRSDAAPAIRTASAGNVGLTSPANPSATAGPSGVNGSALTFMRSDAAPAVQAATTGQAGITTLATTACSTSSTTVLTPTSATPTTSGALLSGCVGPLRVQAGSATSDGAGNFSITFPTAFPANCFGWTTGQTNNSLVEIASCTTTQITGNTITPSTLAAAPSKSFSYIAVGN